MSDRRPNILLITTDQQRFDHLGLAGVRGIDTPNLDRLGSEGVHFYRAYTSCPICTPARLTLLTGQYPSVHRGYSIGVSVDPFPRPTIADLLSEAGYATALLGKAHFVRRDDEEQLFAGVDYDDPAPSPLFYRDHTGPYLGFEYVQTDKGHTTNRVPGMHYRVFLEDRGVDYSSWYPDMGPGHDHSATGLWSIPPEFHDTRWVTDCTVDWIRSVTEENPERPWFAWASYQDPHEPFVCPDPWFSGVRMDEVAPYEGAREGEFDDRPRFYREAVEAGFGGGASGGDDPAGGRTSMWKSFNDGNGIPSAFNRSDLHGKELSALQATLGMVAYIDSGVGEIMRAIEETGGADRTIVIFTTDHGELHGHHGLWHKGLFAYEDNQRIPLLVWGPGRVEPIGTSQALANLVDLPVTMLEEAGIPAPQGMQGTELQPVLRGEADSVQNATVVELEATQRIYQQTLITDRHKLVMYRELDAGELYDLHEDPDQYRNLWDERAYRSLRESLLQELIRTRMRTEGRAQPRRSFA